MVFFWEKEHELGEEDVSFLLQSSDWRGQEQRCQGPLFNPGWGPLFCWTLIRWAPPAPPGHPALPRFTWGRSVKPVGEDQAPASRPRTLKTPSQRAGLAAPCHGETEARPPRGVTLLVAAKSGTLRGGGTQTPSIVGTPHPSAQQGWRPQGCSGG